MRRTSAWMMIAACWLALALVGSAGAATGEAGSPAEWVEQLRSPVQGDRTRATAKLSRLEDPAPEVIDAVAALLDDPDWTVRNQALMVLRNFGPDAQRAYPRILATLADEHKHVRNSAAQSLPRIGAHDRQDRLGLVGALNHPERKMRAHASEALRAGGAEDVAAELEVLCRHPDAEVRGLARGVLLVLDPSVAVPVFTRLLESADRELWREAASALGQLGPHAGAAAAGLARRLDEPHDYGSALQALEKLGPAAEPALPALLAMLERFEQSYPAAPRVIRAVAAVGPPARIALPTFRQMLAEAELFESAGSYRATLVQAIRELGGEDDAALREYALRCARGLVRANPMIRLESAQGLITLGNAAAPARDALSRALREEHEAKIRRYVAEALGAMGAAARPALPTLRRAQQDPNERVREHASAAIERIETSPQTALPQPSPPETETEQARVDTAARAFLSGSRGGERAGVALIEAGAASLPPLHRALLEDELGDRRNLGILQLLGWIGDASSVEVVISFARARAAEPGVAVHALRILLQLPAQPGARRWMRELLEDPAAPVRQRQLALLWYAEHRDPAGAAWVQRFRADPDPELRFAALYLAAFLGDASAAAPISTLLGEPGLRSDRYALLLALAEVTSPEDFDRLSGGGAGSKIETVRRMLRYRNAPPSERRDLAERMLRSRELEERRLVARERIAEGDLAFFEPLLEQWPMVGASVRVTVASELARAGYRVVEKQRRFVIEASEG